MGVVDHLGQRLLQHKSVKISFKKNLFKVTLHTLDYQIVVGLRLFINPILFENVDEKKMTPMPRLM